MFFAECRFPVRILLAAVFAGLVSSSVQAGETTFEWTGFFARRLSEYNLFEDPVQQKPNEGLLPFDLITPLFSDYAHKNRFVLLPEGGTIDYSDTGVFNFPVGTALLKTFSYPYDFRRPQDGHRLIETRLLVHTEDRGWFGAAYLWNDEQTDAELLIAGTRLKVDWVHFDGEQRSTQYLVPNMNQCRFCHSSHGAGKPLGPTARQLNHDFTYEDGHRANQLAEWTARGLLRGAPDPESAPRVAQWDDPHSGTVFDRVRGYLDTNCSHCHQPGGLASSKRIDLRYAQTEPWKRGVELRSTGGNFAESKLEKVIVSGHPERSSVYRRVVSTDFTFMMPQIGRSVVHEEGAALIAEWIRSLEQ